MTAEASAFDPKRRLCPDGACLGVIGADGRCRVCGRTGDGKHDGRAGGAVEDADGADAGAITAGAPAVDGDGGFVAGRKLCPDGTCVGIIGADGRCKVCGAKE